MRNEAKKAVAYSGELDVSREMASSPLLPEVRSEVTSELASDSSEATRSVAYTWQA